MVKAIQQVVNSPAFSVSRSPRVSPLYLFETFRLQLQSGKLNDVDKEVNHLLYYVD